VKSTSFWSSSLCNFLMSSLTSFFWAPAPSSQIPLIYFCLVE
jgi:hypothetical protein